MRKIAIVLLSVSGLSFAGATEGKALYASKCASCHGPDGKGKDAIAKMMKVEMKPLGSQSEADIEAAITNGKGKMKPVAGVDAKQAADIAAYVKTLGK
jgi:mono/diheme cytochrome c family protein